MGADSKIEWTDASWTPIRAIDLKTGKVGWHCERATTGCEFCYSESMNKRLGTGLSFKPGHREYVKIFLDDKMLAAPLHWKKPRKIFVCSMTDAFADFVTDDMLDKMFAVMALCPQHSFQVLTKRAERMRQWFANVDRADQVGLAMLTLVDRIPYGHRRVPWPLPNVWLGVSAERQQEADERIPHLLNTPAAIRFVSAEPLLGPINFSALDYGRNRLDALAGTCEPHTIGFDGLDWIIVGGESGPNARPMHPQWARDIRDQCAAAAVSFFFKQWGEWAPLHRHPMLTDQALTKRGAEVCKFPDAQVLRVGKKSAGRLLDGKEHNAFPNPRPSDPDENHSGFLREGERAVAVPSSET